MLRYILRRLLGAGIVIFSVFTLSFIIMRVSPGSPFDEDRELPADVVANQAETTGMAAPVSVPMDVVLVESLVTTNDTVRAGTPYARVLVNGVSETLQAESTFQVFRVVRRKGESIPKGSALIYRHTGLWTQYLTTLRSYLQLNFGATFESKGQRTVLENIADTLPVSMELGLYALIIALSWGSHLASLQV